MQGLAKGLGLGFDQDVTRAITRVNGRLSAMSFDMPGTNGTATAQPMTVSIVINGVLDGEDAARKLKKSSATTTESGHEIDAETIHVHRLGQHVKSLNDPLQDIAVLAQFSVQWGVETADEQPDPSVMSFTLRDLRGWLTGRALTLAGARILVQISKQPTWAMLTDAMGTWKAQRCR